MTQSPWTDEQEAALLRAIIRYKPVGMHAHFRMVAIHNYMASLGVISPSDTHTSIPGLWEKLESLYNLPVLNEREDAVLNESDTTDGGEEETFCPFRLPDEEYGERMWEKRLDPNGDGEEEESEEEKGSEVLDTDEGRSSSAVGTGARRMGRGVVRGGRPSRLRDEAVGSQRGSGTASTVGDEEVDEDELDSGEEDEEGSEPEEEPEQPPKKRTKRRGTTPSSAKTTKRSGVVRKSARRK